MQKAVFFDRDGIVNRRYTGDYVKSIDEFVFLPDFFKLFALFKRLNFACILATNQQCIGKWIITEEKLKNIHDYMQQNIYSATGYKFDGIYFCPHLSSDNCPCRKPKAGMFEQAIKKFDIDQSKSWTIGDSVSDVIAGKTVGTNTVLIGDFKDINEADYIFQDLAAAYNFFKN